jgi:hypothetical protein
LWGVGKTSAKEQQHKKLNLRQHEINSRCPMEMTTPPMLTKLKCRKLTEQIIEKLTTMTNHQPQKVRINESL